MTKRAGLPLALLALTVAAGCSSGTETGNPEDPARVTFGALPGSSPARLALSEARVSVPSILLTGCGGEAGPTLEPQALDLVLPGVYQARFDHAMADACGVTLELGPSMLAEPAELSGLTALFRGTREGGEPFEIRSTYAQHLPLVADTPLRAERLFVLFDLGAWLDAADLPSLPLENGIVAVGGAHNPAALAAFEAASGHSVALYLDANGDGHLEGGELTPVAVPQ